MEHTIQISLFGEDLEINLPLCQVLFITFSPKIGKNVNVSSFFTGKETDKNQQYTCNSIKDYFTAWYREQQELDQVMENQMLFEGIVADWTALNKPIATVFPENSEAVNRIIESSHLVINTDTLCNEQLPRKGLSVSNIKILGYDAKIRAVRSLAIEVLSFIDKLIYDVEHNKIELAYGIEDFSENDPVRMHWIQDVDLGLSQDVSVIDDLIKAALHDLFNDKEDTPWNRWLAGSLIRGICCNLPEVATIWENISSKT